MSRRSDGATLRNGVVSLVVISLLVAVVGLLAVRTPGRAGTVSGRSPAQGGDHERASTEVFGPMVVDVPGCVGTSGYQFSVPASNETVRVFVGDDLGGPVAVLVGASRTESLSGLETRGAYVDRNANGLRQWMGASGPVATLESKRMSREGLERLAAAVTSGSVELPDGLSSHTPTGAGAEVIGTSCEIGDDFYGVEVIQGDRVARAAYLLTLDPVAVVNSENLSIAIFNPAHPETVPTVRSASGAEWDALRAHRGGDRSRSALPPHLR